MNFISILSYGSMLLVGGVMTYVLYICIKVCIKEIKKNKKVKFDELA